MKYKINKKNKQVVTGQNKQKERTKEKALKHIQTRDSHVCMHRNFTKTQK